jgi:hypothetical protein
MRELIRIAIGFFVAGTVFLVVESLFPSKAGQRKWRKGIETDLFYWVFTPLASHPVAATWISGDGARRVYPVHFFLRHSAARHAVLAPAMLTRSPPDRCGSSASACPALWVARCRHSR